MAVMSTDREPAFTLGRRRARCPTPDPTPAIESYATDSRYRHDGEPEKIVEAEIVEPEGEPADDTPSRIAEMIKAGVFDQKAGD